MKNPHPRLGADVDAPPKTFVRKVVHLQHWDQPAGNLLVKYLEACREREVVAQTGVARKLMLRVRGSQPLPYQKVAGKTWPQLLELLIRHLDPANCGVVPLALSQAAVGTINPRISWEMACRRGSPHVAEAAAKRAKHLEALKEKDYKMYVNYLNKEPPLTVSTRDLTLVIEAAKEAVPPTLSRVSDGAGVHLPTAPVSEPASPNDAEPTLGEGEENKGGQKKEVDPEVLQGVLEVLAFPTAVEVGPAEKGGASHLLHVLFDHLDLMGEDALSVEDVRGVAHSFLADRNNLQALELEPLTRQLDSKVSRDEFMSIMLESIIPMSSLTPNKVFSVINELFQHKLRPNFSYDFSKDYLGPAGMLALIDALKHDTAFSHLGLSKSGISDASVEVLCEWLKDHPSITSLDLSENSIGDRGGVALTELLRSNTRITQLNISGIHLLRNFSRNHHYNLESSVCEDAAPIMEALTHNYKTQRRKATELVRLLRAASLDLKLLFFAMTDRKSGKIELPKLQAELRAIGLDWGFDEQTVDSVVLSERLWGTGGMVTDDSGTVRSSYSEFMLKLEAHDRIQRVMLAIRHDRLIVKRKFYELAGGSSSSQEAGGDAVLDPVAKVSISSLKQVLLELAQMPGSGWGVSLEDLGSVLTPSLFLQYGPSVVNHPDDLTVSFRLPTQPLNDTATLARPPSMPGVGDVGQEPAEAAAGAGAGAGETMTGDEVEVGGGEQEMEDAVVTWSAFFNTVLFLLNR